MKDFTNMKFALLLAVMLAMVGCAKEQSSLDASDMPNRAKIIGSFYYDEGQDYVGGDYVCLIKPAAGVKVEVTLPASQYSPNGSAQGVVTYYTYTNTDGEFEISVPIPSGGVTATVRPADFMGTYTTVEGVEDGKPVYAEKEVVFSAATETIDLRPNAIEMLDALYTHEARDMEEGYPYVSAYNVVVGKATYSIVEDEFNQEQVAKEYKLAKDVDVVISVTYPGGKVLKYAAATDNDGVAVFNIPAREKAWTANIKVEAKTEVVDRFTYCLLEYDDNAGENVVNRYFIEGGYFQQTSVVSSTVTFSSTEGVPTPEARVKMLFTPFDDVEDYGYSTYEWSGVEF